MNADGSGCQKIEELGTYPEWSPKHNEIAYIERLDNNPNLCVHDLATHEHRNLSGKQYLAFKLMRWSPDGKWICFRGELPDGGLELAAVHTEGEKKGLKNPLVALDLRRTEPRVYFECRLERHERGDSPRARDFCARIPSSACTFST